MDNCIFCKIAKKEIPSEIVYENDLVMAFKDANPVADTHLLLIPKKHYPDILALAASEDCAEISTAITKAIKDIAESLGIDSFHILNNCGKEHGQSVFHVHYHLIHGRDLTKMLL